jgi:hypothetical protein
MLPQVYSWSKKIHKIVMWGVVVLGAWMMTSGYLMHHELEGDLTLAIDMEFVRYWHNGISQYFLVVLLLQMATGLTMWVVPKMLSRSSSNRV